MAAYLGDMVEHDDVIVEAQVDVGKVPVVLRGAAEGKLLALHIAHRVVRCVSHPSTCREEGKGGKEAGNECTVS